jgi:phosphatidylglycerol lysyltransferase
MSWAKREGYHWFNCGLTPVSEGEAFRSTPQGEPLHHLLDRQGAVYGAGRDARHSLAPFAPVWEPRYLASPGGMTLPRVLTNLTELVVRGPES